MRGLDAGDTGASFVRGVQGGRSFVPASAQTERAGAALIHAELARVSKIELDLWPTGI
jgi:hypothetical protein